MKKQTLEIQQKTLLPNHPDLAAIYNNMDVTQQSMKEYSGALDYYKKALAIQEKAGPAMHPDIATTHHSMATVYINLNDYKSALQHEERTVEIASQTPFRSNLERIRSRVEST